MAGAGEHRQVSPHRGRIGTARRHDSRAAANASGMVRDFTSGGPEWQTAVKRGGRDGLELALPRLHEPALDDCEVVLGQPATWVDSM